MKYFQQNLPAELTPSGEGRWTLFSNAVNGGNIVVDPDGMDLRRMQSYAPVFWNHDHKLNERPIGRLTDIRKESDRVTAQIEFNQNNPKAVEIEQDIKDGFLRAGSVGFLVKGVEDPEAQPLVVTQSELFEYSIVGVPMDGTAVKEEMLQNLGHEPNTSPKEVTNTLKEVLQWKA